MTFSSKFFHSFSKTSDLFYGQNLLNNQAPPDAQTLFNGFVPHPPQSATPQSGPSTRGTLTQAELQRVVAEMVG